MEESGVVLPHVSKIYGHKKQHWLLCSSICGCLEHLICAKHNGGYKDTTMAMAPFLKLTRGIPGIAPMPSYSPGAFLFLIVKMLINVCWDAWGGKREGKKHLFSNFYMPGTVLGTLYITLFDS